MTLEQYQPTPEETAEAEAMMTDEEKSTSKERAEVLAMQTPEERLELKMRLESLHLENQETYDKVLQGYINLADNITTRLKNLAVTPEARKKLIQEKKEYLAKIREIRTRCPEFASVGETEEQSEKAPEKTLSTAEESLPARKKRIEVEDEKLKNSPEDRKMKLLDYFRRGRLQDNIDILPNIISLIPEIFKSGLVDFTSEKYSEEKAKKNFANQIRLIGDIIAREDNQIRKFLKKYGLAPKNKNTFVNDLWFAKIQTAFYKLGIPTNEKVNLSATEHKARTRRVLASKLGGLVEGDIEDLVNAYEENQNLFSLNFSEKKDNLIIDFVFSRATERGYLNPPVLSEYAGEIVEEPPRFVDKDPTPGLIMVERDKLPSIKGGVMVDGNFGYDENGVPLRPEDKIIIDHHDKFDIKTHDTATLMALRFIENPKELARLKDPEFLDEDGKLNILTNHIDSDSIFSTWIMQNRQRLLEKRDQDIEGYKKLKNIMVEVTRAGDFLLGGNVLETGATPRDYEYIIRGYLNACRQQIKEARLQKLEVEIERLSQELRNLEDEITKVKEDIAVKKSDPKVKSLEKEIQIAQKNKDWGTLKKLKNEITVLLGNLEDKKNELNQKIKEVEGLIKSAEKVKSNGGPKNLSFEENTQLLSHMHDILEDIFANPFKYKKFLLEERAKENKTIEEVDSAYRRGDIEIAQDQTDQDIIFIRPLEQETGLRLDNIDGEYFFYRRREDFNRELVVKFEKNSFMMAINTQNMKGLAKYDFNKLVDVVRSKEDEAINNQINEKELELATVQGDKKNYERIVNELKTLKADKKKNAIGQLWRNRTQMIFAFKTYLSEEEIMSIVYEWKNKDRNLNDQREKEVQEINFEIALKWVCEKYPEFSEKIKNSLETPQLGEYHNEGVKMSSHLSLMLATLEAIKDGQFHKSIKDINLKELMKRIALKQREGQPRELAVNPALVEYIFFHDIAKPDCLALKIEGVKKRIEITSEQWKEIEKAGKPYQLKEKLITSISYFHSSEKAMGQHGNKAAEMLKDKGVSPEIILAISKHEIAYQFDRINAATYEEHFVKPGFSEEQQEFILVASYLDTMASLGSDSNPDLSNFVNLVKSRDNFLLIKQYVDNGVVFRGNELAVLKKQNRVLTAQDVEKIIPSKKDSDSF